MTYGKSLTSNVKMESIWGPVLYCNILAALPMFLIGYFNNDFDTAYEKVINLPPSGVLTLLFTCVTGTLIG